MLPQASCHLSHLRQQAAQLQCLRERSHPPQLVKEAFMQLRQEEAPLRLQPRHRALRLALRAHLRLGHFKLLLTAMQRKSVSKS